MKNYARGELKMQSVLLLLVKKGNYSMEHNKKKQDPEYDHS